MIYLHRLDQESKYEVLFDQINLKTSSKKSFPFYFLKVG